MEVVCKVCAAVVNFRIKQSMDLNNTLHGFRSGRGTGTATLEEKLVQQLTGIANEPLLQVSLDVQKLYDSLDRGAVYEDTARIQDGFEHGPPPCTSIG